jgi:hypothetical protein
MSGSGIIRVDSCPFVVKKAMLGKIAWLKSPVRHRTLAPFGGITRIRFKGSSNWTSQPLRLPRIVELRIRPDPAKSTQHKVRTPARQGNS